MADSVGVEREAREVIAEAVADHDWVGGDEMYRRADLILGALAEAGISVGRWEQVDGYMFCTASETVQGRLPRCVRDPGPKGEHLPLYRRVDDGATGEQTE